MRESLHWAQKKTKKTTKNPTPPTKTPQNKRGTAFARSVVFLPFREARTLCRKVFFPPSRRLFLMLLLLSSKRAVSFCPLSNLQ